MSNSLRKEVLKIYRQLLKTERSTFKGDQKTMIAAFEKTKSEFQAHKNLTDEKEISKKLKRANEIEMVIRKLVVQGIESEEKPGVYKLRLTSEHEKIKSDDITDEIRKKYK